MERLSTTPFGRRTLTLAMLASQVVADACPPDTTVHKWNIFRDICEGKARSASPTVALQY